jgi:hypothetical protein
MKAFQAPREASSPLEITFHLGVRNTAFSSLDNFSFKLLDPSPDPLIQFYPRFNPNPDPQNCEGAVLGLIVLFIELPGTTAQELKLLYRYIVRKFKCFT